MLTMKNITINDNFSSDQEYHKSDQGTIITKDCTSHCSQYLKKGKWNKEEDFILKEAIDKYGSKNWKIISDSVQGRSSVQCLHRWSKILKPGLVKGPWSIEQDRKLLEWIKSEGAKHWNQCAEYVNGRTGKQCRERWFNTLNPQIRKGEWTPEEDFIIFESFRIFGSQWTNIAKKLNNGRTENSIKNRFYSTLRRISAKKKNESWEMNCNLPFDKIIQYLPDAIMEKTISFINYINEQQFKREISNEEIIANNTNDSNYLTSQNAFLYVNKLDDKLIQKFNQTKSQIYSNINQINESDHFSNNNYKDSTEDKTNTNNNLDTNIKNLIFNNENNYFVGNCHLNNLIEKLLFNKNFKVENCSGQSYYIDIKKQQFDLDTLNQIDDNKRVNWLRD